MNLKLHVIIALFFVSITYFSNSQTYTTLKSGNWSDTVMVWSLDGVTACNCGPGQNSGGANIVIRHNLSIPFILDFTNGSVISIERQAIVTSMNKLTIWDASLTIDSSLLHLTAGGEIEIKDQGTISLISSGKITIEDNNDDDITNAGTMNVCNSCCIHVSNAIDNSGAIIGSGSIISDYELDNKGSWDENIVWCADNFNGLAPETQNCDGAIDNCSNFDLPVELVSFEGKLIHNNLVRLDWVTISERDNAYFKIMKSTDLENWNVIGTVEGSGNSIEKICYSYDDLDLTFETAYYQLIQVDFSGIESYSKVISVRNERDLNEVIIYPNPVKSYSELTIDRIETGHGLIYLMNDQGSVIKKYEVEENIGQVKVQLPELSSDMYLINVQQCGKSKTMKLIVLD